MIPFSYQTLENSGVISLQGSTKWVIFLWPEGMGSDGGLCSQSLSQISGSKWGTSWYHFSFPIWMVTAKHQTSTENENDLGKTGIKIQ